MKNELKLLGIILGGLCLVSFVNEPPKEKGLAERMDWIEKQRTPSGTVVAFMGDKAPDGWAICNGEEVEISKYPDLYKIAKDERFGKATTGHYKLPNLQGYFLRGADPEMKIDKDFIKRTGGKGDNKIGSIQLDELKGHGHGFKPYSDWMIANMPSKGAAGKRAATKMTVGDRRGYGNGGTIQIVPAGGSESRPKNIAVNYIIKL